MDNFCYQLVELIHQERILQRSLRHLWASTHRWMDGKPDPPSWTDSSRQRFRKR